MREMTYIMAIDQGTTSSRAVLVTADGRIAATAQREHEQIFPQPGWVEHDPLEVWHSVTTTMLDVLRTAGASATEIAAIGITNQRETTVVWDRHSGTPIANAIVWQDTRTQPQVDRLAAEGGSHRFTSQTGLPLASYFSATKIAWLLDRVPGARVRAERGELLAGTMDTWLLWNLTGGVAGGIHVTDVTNASRTLLMELDTLSWSAELCSACEVPMSMLPTIRSSSEVYGTIAAPLPCAGIPIAGILGDQQAAAFGQAAFEAGDSKNTYGTGNFLLVNTGETKIMSSNGLITTVAYQLAGERARFALEGSIAVTGSLVQWLRDNLGIIATSAEIESLATSVPDNGGAYIVPAFSGLFAPHWRPDARGVIVGLTRFVTKAHLARAALEATAYQTRDVLKAMATDTGSTLAELKVDGGMTKNKTLMQFQADILGVPVVRPLVTETTALGAAYVAGLAVGFWSSRNQLRANWREDLRWQPTMSDADRDRLLRGWEKSVTKSLDWVEPDE